MQKSRIPPLYAPRHWPSWIGFGLLRACMWLPFPWMMAVGRFIGRRAMGLAERRATIAAINFDLCFPELTPDQQRELTQRHFESLGMGLMDMAFAWWASDKRFRSLVRVQGAKNLKAVAEQGKGVILLTAHFTSIEVSGRAVAKLYPSLAMYRPNENPVIQHMLAKHRGRHTVGTIPREDVREMLKALKRHQGVWFAPDQNFGHKGSVFADFFGIPAATNTATSRFARITGAAVVPFVAFRRPDGQGYDLVIEPALEDFPSRDVQADTQRINDLFERWARRAPEQYFWTHRRFKDRPDNEPRFY